MKKLGLILLSLAISLSCYATEYSEFSAKQYAERTNKEKVRITVKKEHVEEYAQEIGSQFFPYIAYGYGDLKAKKTKKQRITYICLLDLNLKPVWSYVVSGK